MSRQNATSANRILRQGADLQRQGKSGLAAGLYRSVLGNDPLNADALHLLGLTHYEAKEFTLAEELIRKALKVRPNAAAYHHNLAAVLSVSGCIAEAEGHYREAIRLDPGYAEAFYNLSVIIKLRSQDPLIYQIETLLQKDGLCQKNQCFLHFAVGKLLDDIGEYDRAFGHFRAGNRAKTVLYDKEKVETFLEALISIARPEILTARSARGYASRLPVFIVGMPRSGTSLVEQILSSHPLVHGAGELPDISVISQSLRKHPGGGRGYPSCLPHIDQSVLNGMAKAYVQKLSDLAPGAVHVINKMPTNFWHLGLIASMFPHARIIHCRRDPLDTCLSCFFQNFTHGQEYAFDLVSTAE